MLRIIGMASLFLLNAGWAMSQTAAPPVFEVASVKVASAGTNDGGGHGRLNITPSPSGVSMINVPLKAVIQWAYHVQAVQVSGPGWLDGDRYDVIGKTAGVTSEDQQRQMMQTLLADRFKLTFHRESKEMRAFVASVAKTGLKMKESTTEGDMDMKPSGKAGATIQRATIAKLVELLSGPLQAPVIDETGLTGRYDFTIDVSNVLDPGTPMGISDVIPIFVQLAQQQLGIKIEEKKVSVEMLMVDHVERVPVEN